MMKIIKQDEYALECVTDDKTFHIRAKWDGCCDISRYWNGFVYGDPDIPDDEIDSFHICDLREFINFLTKVADEADMIDGFEGYEKGGE